MTKIVCLSDTHCKLDAIQVPQGDILLHAGDLTFSGNISEMASELKKLGNLPFDHIVYVPGNHDWLAERNELLLKDMCADNGILYLNNSGITLNGLNIWGSGITPRFFNWALNVDRGPAIKLYWDAIPDNTDVLVTHGPPKGHHDYAPMGGHVGCEDLLFRMHELKNLKLHVFGHIHEGYGSSKLGNVRLINASNCDGKYKPINKPMVISI